MDWEYVLPNEIEARSFEIIENELDIKLDSENASVIKRVIHTTAEFDYAKNLVFSDGAVALARQAIKNGASIVTDTQMVMAGINKKALSKFGGEVYCFMSDELVAKQAAKNNTTRAVAAMEKTATLDMPLIVAVGNAPTALRRLAELTKSGAITPKLIVGVPVGFVNVVQSKEMIFELDVPYIVARGRKGGSNVAAAIINALIYK